MKMYPHSKERDEWVLNLSGAIVASVAKDYRTALVNKCRDDNRKCQLIDKHTNFQKDIKTKCISGSEFISRSEVLMAERKKLAMRRKKNRSEIKSLESWFLSDYGNMLSLGQGQYISEKIRNEVM